MNPSLLRKSLDWDNTTFSTCEGFLNSKELCLVNKGLTKSKSNQPSTRTRTKTGCVPPRPYVSVVKHSNIGGKKKNESESEKENMCDFGLSRKSDLINVKGQQSCIKLSQRSCIPSAEHSAPCLRLRTPLGEKLRKTSNDAKECDRVKIFGGANSHVQSNSMKPRRQGFVLKSIDWDSALFTCEGLLNSEELRMIDKSFEKEEYLNSGIKIQMRPQRVAHRDQTSRDSDEFHLEISERDTIKDVNPDFKKLTKRSKVSTNISGPASGQANTISKKMNIKRKINTRNMKATTSRSSALSPLTSSNTSLSNSFHKVISASDFQTPTHDSCRMLKGRKLLTSPYTTRSSMKKIAFSGLRMPSPRLGFFD